MGNRPFVQIDSKNEIKSLYKHLEKTLPTLIKYEGVIGITLNGGMSRGYADYLSEIDLTLYLNAHTYKEWTTSLAPITLGISKINGILYDIKIINIEDEKERKWTDIDQWDYSYTKILYDPYSEVKSLFKSKQIHHIDISQVEHILFSCWWNYRLAGDIWIYRGDVIQGHIMLNEAVEQLVKALFIANQEWIPHKKWLIHMSRSLNWKPNNWDDRLNQSMLSDHTIKSLKDRQTVIDRLWIEIDNYIRNKYFKNLPIPVMYKYFYDLMRDLVEHEWITIDEWKEKTSLEMLNIDPFHKIVSIQENKIILDRNKLLSLKPQSMYAWYYKIVETINKR